MVILWFKVLPCLESFPLGQAVLVQLAHQAIGQQSIQRSHYGATKIQSSCSFYWK
jgi:hypothetical protein